MRALAASCVAALLACGAEVPAPEPVSDGRYQMGTVLQITLYGAEPELLEDLFARVEELEARVSSWRETSDVSRLSAAAGLGPQPVHEEVARLLEACVGYTRLTHGSFDVTVGPLVRLWRRAGETGRRPSADALSLARALVGADQLRVDRDAGTAELLRAGMSVDLGGIAKGTATDAIAEQLAGIALLGALIDFGGSSLHGLGAPPDESGWRVLVRDGAGSFAGVVTLRDKALSVSSSLGQYSEIDGERFGHVLDPRTGEPLRTGRTAIAVASSGELAEVLTKALLVLPQDEALRLVEGIAGAEALLVDEQRRRMMTSGFERAVDYEPVAAQEPSYQMR